MNKLNINFNKLQKNLDDNNLKDLIGIEANLELQSILTEFLIENKNNKTLKTTEEALKSLKKLNVITEKVHKKLKTNQKKQKKH